MKKVFTLCLTLYMFFGGTISALATDTPVPINETITITLPTVKIAYNGEPRGTGYLDENGRTLVNLRWLSDVLLCDSYGNTYGEAYCQIMRAGSIIAFRPGVSEMYVDHVKRVDGLTIQIDTSARYFKIASTDSEYYTDQRNFFVPLRYVAEAFGMKVDWDGEKRQVLTTEETNSILDNCNAASLWIDTDEFVGQGEIITKITSLDEYTAQFPEDNQYGADFFADNYLLIAAWTDSSGGFSADVADIRITDDGLVIFVRRHNPYGPLVTMAHVPHCLAFEVPKAYIEYEASAAFIYTAD